jgi:ribosomal protein S18 acetylase RimI-like enzyme
MTEVRIREFQFPDDYEHALQLWRSVGPGVRVGPSDAPAEIEKKLERDPDLFLVAEANGALVGSVMGGFDGRRGLVYHLAVAPQYRRKRIASLLMEEVESRLRLKGCLKCYLLVRPDNADAMTYYKKIGWSVLDDVIFAKEFNA